MDAAFQNQWTPQDMLGQVPPVAGGNHTPPDMDYSLLDTVPPPSMLPPTLGASDSYLQSHAQMGVMGPTGQQTFSGGGASPVIYGDSMHNPQYAPLSRVAFAPIEQNHRTWANLIHPQPVTADRTPRPDWNPFQQLQNWPMKAASGLRTTVFGRPQQPSLKGAP